MPDCCRTRSRLRKSATRTALVALDLTGFPSAPYERHPTKMAPPGQAGARPSPCCIAPPGTTANQRHDERLPTTGGSRKRTLERHRVPALRDGTRCRTAPPEPIALLLHVPPLGSAYCDMKPAQPTPPVLHVSPRGTG